MCLLSRKSKGVVKRDMYFKWMISLCLKPQSGMRAELNTVEKVELDLTDTNVIAGDYTAVR